MAQQIPPPPPGFSIVGGGSSAPAPRAAPRQPTRQASRYSGPLPDNAEALFPALIRQESGGRAGILGPQTRYGQAIGRTQMLPATAREVAQKIGVPYREDLLRGTSPEAAQYQDRLGLAYLQEGFERTGNARDALHYYHGGPDRSLWGPKTRSYADSILSMTAQGQGEAPALETAQLTAGAPPPPPPGFKIVAAPSDQGQTQPIEVEIDEGVQNVNGRAILAGEDVGSWESFQARNRRSNEENVKRAEREADPEYQRRYADASSRAGNIPDWLLSVTGGATLGGSGLVDEIIGGLDYIGSGFDATAGQAARDAIRDEQAEFAAERPGLNLALQVGGGFATPGLGAAGNFISRGAGAARLGRAGAVGAGYGAASGVAGAEGNLAERIDDAALGAVVGGGTGVVGQRGVDRITAALGRGGRPTTSNARLLSREGVTLTPGQMASEVPGIGPILRSLEEGASSIPFVGSPIAGARQQSVETFNRAAINRALAPLNAALPRGTRPGYASVEAAQGIVSQAYDDALRGVQMIPDQEFYDDIGRSINATLQDAGVPQARNLAKEINDRVFRALNYADDPISGTQFKSLESEFGNLARLSMESTDGASRALGRAYQNVQAGMRDALARQNPEAADALARANGAYARLMRVEDAAASTASQTNDGVFTPTQLGQAVGRRGSRRASARGDSLMQDLAVAGRDIIPSRVGDSGTATRGAITGLVAGAATGVPLGGAVAIPVVASSVLYSRPAQALINAVYRATDSRQAMQAVQELERIAARNPALLPYYEDALQFARGLALPDTEAAPQGRASTPTPTLVR